MSSRLTSLDQVAEATWRELAAAALDRGHEWQHPVLATVDGEVADARTVVLREVDVEQHLLRFYTDERAGKVAQLERHPLGTLVCWSRRLGWQLRLRVQLGLLTSGLAVSSRWAHIRLTPAAHDYLSPLPPGATLDEPAPAGILRSSAVERVAFSVVEAQVLSLDWLELHREGHRRARFDTAGARWLQP